MCKTTMLFDLRLFLTLLCFLFFTREAISRTSMINWRASAQRLTLLPKFVSSKNAYLTKQPFQPDTFVLKNGKQIVWMANDTDSILHYKNSTEQPFVLPKKDEPIFSIWDADGNAGFIDVNGKVVWKLPATIIGDFSEGLAPVLIGDKWGYANRAGEIVIKPRWKNLTQGWLPTVSQFSEGLAAVTEAVHWDVIADSNYYAYKCGYINIKGEYVIPPKFRQSCGVFSEGLARISVDWQGDEYEEGKGWLGFLDKQGNWAIKPRLFEAGNFADGFAPVRSEIGLARDNLNREPLSLIDKTGRKVTAEKDCRWRDDFHEGLALTYAENNQVVFINEQCEAVFRLAPDIKTDISYLTSKSYDDQGYAHSTYFTEGLLPVYKEIAGEKIFGYLDRTGKTAIPFQFANAAPFFDGLAGVIVKEKGETFNAYINPKGEIVLRNTRSIAPFYNGLAFHFLKLYTIRQTPRERNIYGYMNKQGKYVWLSPRAEIHLDKNWIKENFVRAKQN